MPFLISGNLDKIDNSALIKFQKNFGIILSKNQFTKQQYYLIQNSIIYHHDYIQRMTSMSKESLFGFLFILSQFGDVIQSESPQNFIKFNFNYSISYSFLIQLLFYFRYHFFQSGI